MKPISVIIITKNEAHNIVGCILSAKKISKEIIVVDSGSTDDTVLLARGEQVIVESINWRGYGHARNRGANLASNDWVLALDADERITDDLAAAIQQIGELENTAVFGFKRLNFYGSKEIKFGSLKHDKVFRLYNRNYAFWNLVPVHETLSGKNLQKCMLSSFAVHYGIRSAAHYKLKKSGYAYLCALKYLEEGKRFSSLLRFFSPLFNFSKAYFFQMGFLDGRMGFAIASINAQYTFKKYQVLYLLHRKENEQIAYPAILKNSMKWISSFLP